MIQQTIFPFKIERKTDRRFSLTCSSLFRIFHSFQKEFLLLLNTPEFFRGSGLAEVKAKDAQVESGHFMFERG